MKPCKCGSKKWTEAWEDDNFYYIVCASCNRAVRGRTKDIAKNKWNNPGDSQQVGIKAKYEKGLERA